MNRFNFFSAFCLVTLIFSSCKEESFVSFNEQTIRVLDDQLATPISFVSSENGIFTLHTSEKTYDIKGKPDRMQQSADSILAYWQVDDREVLLSVIKEKNTYHFKLQASPGDDIQSWDFQLSATTDEYFTGLFERVVDGSQKASWQEGIEEAMDLRGQQVNMMIRPTLSLYTPFYLSSNNYGLFIKGTWPGTYDFCKSDDKQVQISFEGHSLSGIIYCSEAPSEIVSAHSLHVGPTILPPKWSFLPIRWRDNHEHLPVYYDSTESKSPFNSQLTEDVLMMEAFDIPYGAYWIDRPWAKGPIGYDDFEWDPDRFPNDQEMIDWLNEKNKKLLLWIAPWVDGDMAAEAWAKGYNIVTKNSEWLENRDKALIDFTNPEAVRWWQEEGLAKVLNQGIKGFKLDRSEEVVPESREVTFHDGTSAREMRNAYPVEYVKAVYQKSKEIHGNDFLLFPRAGYTGSSRYGMVWGGDIASNEESLRCAIIAAQRSAIIGFPLWGSDIGGYWQHPLNRETVARWLAFGCFNPLMEIGPLENRAPWDMPTAPSYDTALISTFRLYSILHTQLQDYSYDLAQEAQSTGLPPIRPLFLTYPDEKEAWEDWQTFTYGPDILVSAIWKRGKKSHSCYLPAGDDWIDAWNPDNKFEGGQYVEVETPFHKIPIFIRKGASVSLGDLNALYEESFAIASEKPDLKSLEQEAFGSDLMK